jgi:hypothetical protein
MPLRWRMDDSMVSMQLRVGLGDGTPDDDLDLATRDLRLELLDAGVGEAEMPSAAIPTGAKAGTGSVVGDLAIAVLPTLLPKLIDLLKEWRNRAEGRSIKVQAEVDGNPVEITIGGKGADADAAAKLIAGLRAGSGSKKKRAS